MSFSQNYVSSEPASKRLRMAAENVSVGSLVWARASNFIWWPAIVTEKHSPYFRIQYADNVSCVEGWVNQYEMLQFTGVEESIDGETCSNGIQWDMQLKIAVGLARTAMKHSCEDLSLMIENAKKAREELAEEQWYKTNNLEKLTIDLIAKVKPVIGSPTKFLNELLLRDHNNVNSVNNSETSGEPSERVDSPPTLICEDNVKTSEDLSGCKNSPQPLTCDLPADDQDKVKTLEEPSGSMKSLPTNTCDLKAGENIKVKTLADLSGSMNTKLFYKRLLSDHTYAKTSRVPLMRKIILPK